MLEVIDFSAAATRPVPYPYIDSFCYATAGEDASTNPEGHLIFHWDEVAWQIGVADPLPPIDLDELL